MDVSGGPSAVPSPQVAARMMLGSRFPQLSTHPQPCGPHARSPRPSTPAGACRIEAARVLIALLTGPWTVCPSPPGNPCPEAPGVQRPSLAAACRRGHCMYLAGSTPDLSLLPWGCGDIKQLPSRGPLIAHPCMKPPAPHSQQELVHQPPGSRQEGRDGLGGEGTHCEPRAPPTPSQQRDQGKAVLGNSCCRADDGITPVITLGGIYGIPDGLWTVRG